MSRRTLVAGAAWSVPAVTLLSVSPALALSGSPLTVSAPNAQVPASGPGPVTAVAKNSSGQPIAGAAVSFSGPNGATFTPVSATTNGSGTAVTQMDLGTPWAKPGSLVSVTAVSGSDTASGSFTVLGSNVVVAGAGYSSSLAQSELMFPSPVVDAVAAGFGSPWFMVLLANGTVWTKGSNFNGQLGDGSTTDRSTWAPVSGLSGVTQIAASEDTGYALAGGSVKAWGLNNVGQVGDGSTTTRLTPVQVSGLTSGVTQIAAAYRTAYALLAGGSVRAWGSNDGGRVGDGSTTTRLTPVQVSGLTSGVTQIAAGGLTGFALLSDGSVKAWGYNNAGRVGDGSTTDRWTPVQVSGLTSGVTQIAAGAAAGYALLSGGSVRAWGFNGDGEVGDGSTTNRWTPVQVSGLTSGVTQITAGNGTGYALSSDGSVRAWGLNGNGQVGDGSTTNRVSPVSVSLPAGRVERLGSNSMGSNAAMIVMGEPTVSVDIVQTTIAAGSAATVRAKVATASNPSGVAGAAVTLAASGAVLGATSGSTDSTGVFQTIVTPDAWTTPGGFVRVTARNDVSTAVDTATVLGSNVVVAGAGYSSVLAQSERAFPSPVVDAVAAAFGSPWFMVLLANGAVWTKGYNGNGQLGNGSTTDRSTWAPVPGLSGVTQIAASDGTGYALLSDGSVRAWGFNDAGQVGDGSTTTRLTPVLVSGLTSGVTQIAAGYHSSYALLSGGSVKAWGYNEYGQVGDGSTTDRWTPTQVSGLTSGVTQIAAGGLTGFALSSGGSVKGWGYNGVGRVGDGSTTTRVTPTQVSGLTSGVTQIAAGSGTGYALLSGGAVRAWGNNSEGEVGDGTKTTRLAPVQVSGLTSGVTQITAVGNTGYVLLSDGSVKAWGFNGNGQVGDGSTNDRVSPVSVSLPAGRVVQRLSLNSMSSYAAMIVTKTS